MSEKMVKVPEHLVTPIVEAYAMKHYVTDHCTLCGNRGVIDTRGLKTPAGLEVGRLNYCICPNGLSLNLQCGDLEWWVNQ